VPALTFQPSQGNSWWPVPSPTGQYVVYGNQRIWCADLRTGEETEIAMPPGHRGNVVGWYSDVEFLWVDNTDDRRHWLYLVLVGDWHAVRLDYYDPALVAGNWFDASSGHWASSLSTSRLTYDGAVLTDRGLGVRVAGEWLATGRDLGGGSWGIAVYLAGQLQREIRPQGPANVYQISDRGYVAYGYNGPARLNAPDGSDRDVTVTPWRVEGVPAIVHRGSETWLVSGTVERGVPCVVIRQAGTVGRGIVIERMSAAWIAAVVAGSDVVVAASGDRGEMIAEAVSLATPARDLVMSFPPFPRPLFFGGYYHYSTRYAGEPGYSEAYPSNISAVVTERDSDGTVRSLDHLTRALAHGPVIAEADQAMIAYFVTHPADVAKVVALFIGDTGGWQHAAQLAAEAKGRWTAAGLPLKPVLWYITPGEPDAPDFRVPDTVDIVAPEFYFPTPDNLGDQLWRMIGRWIDKLGTGKPWMPVFQAFDRQSDIWRSRMGDLVQITPAFLAQLATADPRVRVVPPAIGALFFAVNRPGGVKDYPALRQVHAALYASIPGAPPFPSVSGGDDLMLKKPELTVDSYTPIGRPGGKAVFHDRENPDLNLRVTVTNVNGSIFFKVEHKGGEGHTGTARPATVAEEE
jgi:hypothetical protein